jgi:hypothetical protein
MGGTSYIGMGGTSLGCLHAFHEDEDATAHYKFGITRRYGGYLDKTIGTMKGKGDEKVCLGGGKVEGAKHAESVQRQQYSNGVFNFFGLFNIFPTHLPAYYKVRL